MARTESGTAASTVPVLRKAVRLLGAVADGSAAATSLAQLAGRHNIATTTCFRIMQTLRAEGWVTPTAAGGWRLSAGLLPLVRGLAPYAGLAERLATPLQQLATETALTAKLSVLEQHESVTLARHSPPQAMSVTSPAGARFPVVLGATGAALLVAGLTAGKADVDTAADAAVDAAVAAAPATAWQRQTHDDLRRRVAHCRAHGWCRDVGGYHARVAAVAVPLPRKLLPAGVAACVSLIGFPEDIEADGQRLAERLTAWCRRLVREAA